MSLFKAREWWSVAAEGHDLHSTGCLAVGVLGNDRYDKILIGSVDGLLRIYSPSSSAFTPEHVVLEKQLQDPIIQVEFGLFIPDVRELAVAVLHPRALVVYQLLGSVEQPVLTAAHSFPLPHTAHSMVVGPFGKVTDQELVCVQSMDGQLSIFDHTGKVVSCFLPDFILPGPLVYIGHTDCLATVSSALQLEVFRYNAVCAASTSASTGTGGRRLMPDWTINLGENAIEIRVVPMEEGPSLLLILGEHSVSCVKDNGVFMFSKSLDFAPSCILPYSSHPPSAKSDQPNVLYLLVSHTQQLMVMSNQVLQWSAELPHNPVAVKVAAFKELQGVVVTVNEMGSVLCSYLGTDPTSLTPVLGPAPQFNVESCLAELRELKLTIEDAGEVTALEEPELLLGVESTSEPRSVQTATHDDDEAGDGSGGQEESEQEEQKCVEVVLTVQSSLPGEDLTEILISVPVQQPLSVHVSKDNFASVGSSAEKTTLTFVCSAGILAESRSIEVTVLYHTPAGLQRSKQLHFELPVSLFCNPNPPVKEAHYKVVFETNKQLTSVSQIYPDLIMEGTPANAIGFSTLAGPIITIVVSKFSDRFRVQSNSFAALYMIIEDLLQRLQHHYTGMTPAFTARMSEAIPLTDYFELIDHHYKLRSTLAECNSMMGRLSHQFRSIQKRLLARFKDKTPISLSNMDTLLNGTSMQLLALADKTEELEVEAVFAGRQLACATRLIVLLLKMKTSLSDEEYDMLLSAFSPHVDPTSDLGWEELTDVAITTILSTTLAKTKTDHTATLPQLELPKDPQRLKRHIALLCDRLQRGARLIPPDKTTNRSLEDSKHKSKLEHKPASLTPLEEETDL